MRLRRLVPRLLGPLALLALLGVPTMSAPAAAVPARQVQCYPETGFCIDQPAFQEYFNLRGGARILGFPVSRAFRLEGFTVQFFQRVVLQQQPGSVARLNLLDPGILPVTRANQSVFPAPDPALASEAPDPSDPAYPRRVVEYLSAVSPDTWNGLPVGFSNLFNTTVPAGGESPEIRTLLNLEIWGLPTSRPQPDPGNGGFVYQRFQRGIMHFRTDCQCTDGILVGDYLKAVLTGVNLPPDLAEEMASSRYFVQYAPGAAGWLARPGQLSDTDLTSAFESGTGSSPQTLPTATPTPAPMEPTLTPTPMPAQPTATPMPPSLASINGRINPGQAGLRVLVLPLSIEASADAGGVYQVAGLPAGEHSVYAIATNGQASDPYRVNLAAGVAQTLNMELSPFKAGSPVVFIGRVVNANNQPVNNTPVWRVGGAGRTFTESDGSFRMVDAFGPVENVASPRKVTFVAAMGEQWGYTEVDFDANANARIEVRLTQSGTPPPMPARVADVRNVTPRLRNMPLAFKSGEADYFTALWDDDSSDSNVIEIKPGGDNLPTVQSQQCLGDCAGYNGNLRVIKLPAQGDFTLGLRADVDPNTVKWREAQVVAFP